MTKMRPFGPLVKIKERADSITLRHFLNDFFIPIIDRSGSSYEAAVDFLNKYEILIKAVRKLGFSDDYIDENFGLSEKLLQEARDCVDGTQKKLLQKKKHDSIDALNAALYDTTILYKRNTINVRPFNNIGFYGKRVKNKNDQVESYLSKINPNKESFYIKNPKGEYIAFDNLVSNTLQVGKLILYENSSWYYVYDRHQFFRQKVLDEAILHLETAKAKNLKLEWLVSDEKAVKQLKRFFLQKKLDVIVSFLPK